MTNNTPSPITKNGYDFPKSVAIIYSDVKREYFPTESQYITEKDADKDAFVIASYIEKMGIDRSLFPGNSDLPKLSGGDLEAALALLDDARRVYVKNRVPDTRPIDALKAKVYLKQGRLAQAQDCAHARGLTADDEISYLGEFEHITLARVLMTEGQSNHADRSILDAMKLLERLLKVAEEGRWLSNVIEILVLQSLALQAQGNIPQALASLERAMTLAEPEGYARIIVDEGLPGAQLLSEAAAHGIMPDYTARLLAVFEAEKRKSEDQPPAKLLNDPLSQRELEVLSSRATWGPSKSV